jgi:hypothetical protein
MSSGSARKLLDSELRVINLGLDIFYNALTSQNVKAIDVDWKPAPKLDKESEDILDKIL